MTPTEAIEEAKAALKVFADLGDIKVCGSWKDGESIQNTDLAYRVKFGDLRRAFRALAALSGAAGVTEGWRTIESAPRDGTLVLCAIGGIMGSCMYRSHMSPNWVMPGHDGWIWIFGKDVPTHWMPLPQPPET